MRYTLLLVLAALHIPLAVGQVRLPPYTRQVLANGAVLDVMPRRDVPLVTIRVVFKGGAEAEPADSAGLADVTAEAIRRGTAKRAADQFSRELDSLGAHFESDADLQSIRINAEFLSKDLAAGLDLLMDAIRNPAFNEAEVKKVIAQHVDAAKGIKDEPSQAVGEYFRSFFYGPSHPYGRPADELSFARISRKDMVDFHKRMFVGRNMIVAVAGDFDPATATKLMADAFGSVTAGEGYQWKQADPVMSKTTRMAIIDKPDATETQFLIGQPGITRMSVDRVPLWVVNTLFGGRFTSILNDELRVNSGLTYGARSRLEQFRLPGRITISSFTRTETTGKAVALAVELLQRLRDKGITAEQLASAKQYLKGTFPHDRLETPDQLVEVLSEIELFDLNRGEIDDLFSRIDAVTLEMATEVIKKYYGAGNLTFLLLGNAAAFEADVKKYAPEVVKVPLTRPGLRVTLEAPTP